MIILRNVATAILAAAGCLVMAHEAQAQSLKRADPPATGTPSSSSAVNPQAADGTLGMALLGAYVRSDAVILSASGVTSVSSIGNGQYSVIFDRDVTNCIFSGTVALASVVFLTVSPYLTPPQVRVVVFQPGGTAVNANFHVMAFCPR